MRKYITIFFSLFFLWSIVSCVKDSANYDECLKAMRIEPRWIDTSPVNNNDIIDISVVSEDGIVERYESDIYGVNVNLMAGQYTITGWERAENAQIAGRDVIVSMSSASSVMEPGPFSAGITSWEVLPDTRWQIIPLPMRQQTRELYIRLIFHGEGLSVLEDVSGTLNGVTYRRDIEDCFPPADVEFESSRKESGKLSYDFEPEGVGVFVGGRNLIGLTYEEEQILQLRILLATENYKDIEFDLDGIADEFHNYNVKEPMYVTIMLNIGAGFELEIIDWISGGEWILDAN